MANTYFSRTITPSTINKKKFTFSAWVKIDNLTAEGDILSFNGSTDYTVLRIKNADRIDFLTYDGGVQARRVSTAKYRDCSAFYHVVLSVNSDDTTADDRIKIYVNGERLTAFDSSVNPSSGFEFINNNKVNLNIGSNVDQTPTRWYFGGIMSHVHFIDGLTYDASAFGETDSTTGIWKPKTAPSVTYGTNGFFLKFENSASLGLDSSVNTNNFTVNGTPTQTVDTPSNVFATMNPLSALTIPPTFSNGNLTTAIPTSGGAFRSTLAVSTGKWYCEVKLNEMVSSMIGIQPIDTTYSTNIFNDGAGIGLYSTSGTIYRNTSNLGNIASVASGDIIGMAIDLDSNNIYFSKNGQYASGIAGSWNQAFGSAYAVATTSGNEYCIAGSNGSSGTTSNFSYNFGNGFFGTTAVSTPTTDESGLGTFEYTVPAGYYALCTKNINTQEYA
mgnify:CR=1 FL=1